MPSPDDAPATPAATQPTLAASPQTPFEPVIEKFAREYLHDRRTDRRWRRFFRLAWLGVFVLLAWSLLENQRGHNNAPNGPHTALVELRGEISSESEASAENMITGLKAAFEDTGAQAVVIRINSPGGSPVQAGIINDEIARLRITYPQKPLYVVVGEMCASGGYYVAAAADKVFVNKASIVGSIGVLMDGFGATGLMEKIGVERRLVTAGENKGFMDPFSPQVPKHKEYAQAMVNEIHQQFIDVVRNGRGKRLKETPDMFSGLFWSGSKAVELGLADGFGTVESVARDELKAENIVDYTQHEGLPERVLKKFGAEVGAAAVRSMWGNGAGPSLR